MKSACSVKEKEEKRIKGRREVREAESYEKRQGLKGSREIREYERERRRRDV